MNKPPPFVPGPHRESHKVEVYTPETARVKQYDVVKDLPARPDSRSAYFEGRFYPTPGQQRIIEIQLEHPEWKTRQKCRHIGITRGAWYAAWNNEHFVQYYNELGNKELKSFYLPLIKASIRYALTNPANYNDRRMLLEKLGEVKDFNEIVHKYGGLSDEELKRLADGTDGPRFIDSEDRSQEGASEEETG